jgi:hypothetical protein
MPGAPLPRPLPLPDRSGVDSDGVPLGLALLLAVSPPPSPAPPAAWRLVDRADLHVGIRPAGHYSTDGPELAAGATLQITTFFLQR